MHKIYAKLEKFEIFWIYLKIILTHTVIAIIAISLIKNKLSIFIYTYIFGGYYCEQNWYPLTDSLIFKISETLIQFSR